MNKNHKVLVVEDNPDNSKLVEKILNHYGYQTIVVESGEKALLWCQENVVDLVLMDISLPQKDGLDTTRELREFPEYQNTPIVALTAHAMVGWDEKCREAGCNGYITKPFRPKNLLEQVKKYISGTEI